MAALTRRALPAGPSYTAIGTLADTVVTPQPAVNALAGGRSIEIQDVCPGRRVVNGLDHIYLAADAVGYALATDALDHPGTADPSRVPPSACLQQTLPGADLVKLATLGPELLRAATVDDAVKVGAEPPLRCPLADGCLPAPPPVTVRILRATGGTRGVVGVRVRAVEAGRLRLRFPGATPAVSPSVAIRRGTQTVRVPARACATARGVRRCRALRPGLRTVAVQVRAADRRSWDIVRVGRVRFRPLAPRPGA